MSQHRDPKLRKFHRSVIQSLKTHHHLQTRTLESDALEIDEHGTALVQGHIQRIATTGRLAFVSLCLMLMGTVLVLENLHLANDQHDRVHRTGYGVLVAGGFTGIAAEVRRRRNLVPVQVEIFDGSSHPRVLPNPAPGDQTERQVWRVQGQAWNTEGLVTGRAAGVRHFWLDGNRVRECDAEDNSA